MEYGKKYAGGSAEINEGGHC